MFKISGEQLKEVLNFISQSSGQTYGEAYKIFLMLQGLEQIDEPGEEEAAKRDK